MPLFLFPLSLSYSLLTLPSARVFTACVHCCGALFSVIQDRTLIDLLDPVSNPSARIGATSDTDHTQRLGAW